MTTPFQKFCRQRFAGLLLLSLLLFPNAAADEPAVVSEEVSSEPKPTLEAETLKTLNDHFPFSVPKSKEHWAKRKKQVELQVSVAAGVYPMPPRGPVEATIFDKSTHDGFTIEKVYFESVPGHFVSGLLFRPTDLTVGKPSADGKRAAVLSPHGHGGRLFRHEGERLEKELKSGGEHFPESGSLPKIARCATLARLGVVTFIFDMVGYFDSIQISHQVAHRHTNPRPSETAPTDDGWVFYSPEAESRLQSILQLQTYNALRSLDFLASLPDVDTDRLAVTGGSGGGTQTLLLGILDDRVKVSFPNGMVSTSMQGGCHCENACGLRINTGNVEFAAMFAPKPQGMTAANDWTIDMLEDGYPQLQEIYKLLGNRSDVTCRNLKHFDHNYNYVTRATMYQWMNRHLGLGHEEPIVEQDFKLPTEQQLSVWGGDHPAPAEKGLDHERAVTKWFDQQSNRWLHTLAKQTDSVAKNDSPNSDNADRKELRAAWSAILGFPSAWIDEAKTAWSNDDQSLTITHRQKPNATIRLSSHPKHSSNADLKIIVGGRTFYGVLGDHNRITKDGSGNRIQKLIDDKRDDIVFTYGYNRPIGALWCDDLMTLFPLIDAEFPAESVTVEILQRHAIAPVLYAASQSDIVDDVKVIPDDFEFDEIRDPQDLRFLPGAQKYGGIKVLKQLVQSNR